MPIPIDPNVLKNQPLFSTLTQTELENLGPYMFEKRCTPGTTLFVEGMSGEVLYLVREGRVDILKKGVEGSEKTLASLKPGEFLGEMTLIEDQPRSATARVAEESVLLVMTKRSFQAMLEKYPPMSVKILLEFLKTANRRLRLANESHKQV
jgi:CRP-like cAMP-binding protein